MAVFSVPNIKLSGLSVAVPGQVQDNMECALLPPQERELFVKTVGIRYRRIAPAGTTAADLCYSAADRLLNELNWNREDINVLVLVTQTPDYLIPNSSSILQHRLGLSKNCLVFDVNLGCSGYVYGLSIVGSFLQNILNGKGLLLVGDVSTQTISSADKSTWPLFSDAGSASAIQYVPGKQMHFNLQTDGKEYDDIIVPDGGFRNRVTAGSFTVNESGKGIFRSALDMKLDGLKIFNFALREVAPNIEGLIAGKALKKDEIDYFLFHQANLLMLESVRKKLKVDPDKVPYSLYDYGNTSSASIPVTLISKLREQLSNQSLRLLLSGFGVGLSWGSAYIETENLICPETIIVE